MQKAPQKYGAFFKLSRVLGTPLNLFCNNAASSLGRRRRLLIRIPYLSFYREHHSFVARVGLNGYRFVEIT